MNGLNEHYLPKMYEAYFSKNIYSYYRQQYHILTSDHKENKFDNWINRWIWRYEQYKGASFPDSDSVVNAGMDCLEEMLQCH